MPTRRGVHLVRPGRSSEIWRGRYEFTTRKGPGWSGALWLGGAGQRRRPLEAEWHGAAGSRKSGLGRHGEMRRGLEGAIWRGAARSGRRRRGKEEAWRGAAANGRYEMARPGSRGGLRSVRTGRLGPARVEGRDGRDTTRPIRHGGQRLERLGRHGGTAIGGRDLEGTTRPTRLGLAWRDGMRLGLTDLERMAGRATVGPTRRKKKEE